ncbi:alanine racemase [Streptomyces bathyalis]|uniref:Alanine racemase n=1 Tax=Streptomyces bathyalis TaxID=2710756 RepID=A0A7T1WTA1_9ACTN|nr:alanine racemase [Streptomyces bathyalis]QPP08379.1 alanine racemase [Streptomyces bathyalis]
MWQAEIRVDLDAVRHNVTRVRAATTSQVMAVVKADAYGHGSPEVARAALEAGADRLGVATLAEAMSLRTAGFTAPVLAWLVGPGMPRAEAVAAGVELSVSSLDELAEVRAAARIAGRPAAVHLKADTGLCRGGARPEHWLTLAEATAKTQADGLVETVGAWSHLVHTDRPEDPVCVRQLSLFAEALEDLRSVGLHPPLRHIANSAAALAAPATHLDLVRVGSAVYGLPPMPGRDFGLRPAMTVRARVLMTKRVPAGCGVSYAHDYTTDRPATLAVVPLGYGDGLPRAAGTAGRVLVHGVPRPIAGRISMDQCVVDCGDLPVAAGDVVTVLGDGRDDAPTADAWAATLGTVSYDIVTGFGCRSRLPRHHTGHNDLAPS